MYKQLLLWSAGCCTAALIGLTAGTAAATSSPKSDTPVQPGAAVEPAPSFHPVAGPRRVELGHDLVMELPADYLYLDPPQAKQLMERNGNLWNDNLLGVVVKQDADWLITIRYTEEGYVKDDEAAKLKADDLLKQDPRRNGRGQRRARQARIQAAARGRVVGAAALRSSGPPHGLGDAAAPRGAADESVNFNTRVLGRKGFVAINLIDAVDAIEASKPAAAAILAATTYTPGARYEDFNGKTDKVAEYGLTALVLGGAGLAALEDRQGRPAGQIRRQVDRPPDRAEEGDRPALRRPGRLPEAHVRSRQEGVDHPGSIASLTFANGKVVGCDAVTNYTVAYSLQSPERPSLQRPAQDGRARRNPRQTQATAAAPVAAAVPKLLLPLRQMFSHWQSNRQLLRHFLRQPKPQPVQDVNAPSQTAPTVKQLPRSALRRLLAETVKPRQSLLRRRRRKKIRRNSSMRFRSTAALA